MKNTIALFAGIATLAFLAPASYSDVIPPPSLFWDFNAATGATTSSSGTHEMDMTMYNKEKQFVSMLGGAGSGVSGAASDRALDFTDFKVSGSERQGGGATGTSLIDALGGITTAKSVTFAGWFLATEEINGHSQFFNQSNAANNGFRIAGTKDKNLSLDIVGTANRKSTSSTMTYDEIGEWIFFAVTFDNSGSDGAVVSFYKGTIQGGVVLSNTEVLTVGDFLLGTYALNIGNFAGRDGGALNRPFVGLLDNMAIWASEADGSGALTLEQLESLRVSQIPEPAAASIAFAMAGALWGVNRLWKR